MAVIVETIKSEIESLISTYDGKTSTVTYAQIASAFPDLALGASGDAIFGSGDNYPTSPTPASGVADFANEYLVGHSINALTNATNSIIAKQLYDFYLEKFNAGLYGLFSSVQELNRKYGGLDPESNQITSEVIQPSFVQVAVKSSTSTWSPTTVTGSFTQPSLNFKNTLSNSSTTSPATLGWVNHYFTVDTQLSAGTLYGTAPELNDISSFVIFGALDRLGNTSGIKYGNAKNNYTKPFYFGHAGLVIGDEGNPSRVINNKASMYIGKSTYGFVGLDFNESIAESGTLDLDVDLLGIMFATAPTIQNSKY